MSESKIRLAQDHCLADFLPESIAHVDSFIGDARNAQSAVDTPTGCLGKSFDGSETGRCVLKYYERKSDRRFCVADGVEDEQNSETSQDHLIEDLNYDAVTIEFYALSLKVRAGGKLVVCGASGKFESSKLTVVMGPSGCGNVHLSVSVIEFVTLLDRKDIIVELSRMSGGLHDVQWLDPHQRYSYHAKGWMPLCQTTVFRNCLVQRYRKVTGFVPQDDIIHPKLTVEENLLFSARYRLTKRMKRQDILAVVDRAIHLLGLVDVRNQLVGNEESRGISGGQRKRVNIGLELVADPWVLFLDEPTSGLDSTSCRRVLSALAKISHMGVTCAAVVHQPSNRVMKMFDDVLLLGRNGRTIYFGPQSDIKTYFRSLGFGFPEDENPADVYLDIITRPKVPPNAPHKSLTDMWETHDFRYRYLEPPQLDADISNESDRPSGQYPANTVLEEAGFFDRIKNILWMSLYLMVFPISIAIDAIHKAIQSLRGTPFAIFMPRSPLYAISVSRSRLNRYTAILSDSTNDEELRVTPGVVTQFSLCFYRCMLERSRSALRIFVEYALYAVSGLPVPSHHTLFHSIHQQE